MAAHPIEGLFAGAPLQGRSSASRRQRRLARETERDGRTVQADANEDVELGLARRILDAAGCRNADLVRCDESMIHFRIASEGDGWKLGSVLFSRPCLEKLANDGCRAVKTEYLERDIARARHHRHTYIYPHSLWALLDD